MPPARRGRPPGSTSSHRNNDPRAAQSTLAFGGRNNKITKPSAPPPSSRKISKPSSKAKDGGDIAPVVPEQENKDVKDISTKHDDVADAAPTEVVEEDATLREGRAMAIRQSQTQKGEVIVKRDADEEKASGVSEAAVKKYWRDKEAERKAPR
ncbi:MAG: hypothetical protein Q9222_005859, partial [Ikaeria aurantiellina]